LRRDPLKPLKFDQSSRKHKIGQERITHVINTYEGNYLPRRYFDQKIIWVGHDFKGSELEVIAVELDNHYFVIHAMPKIFRRRNG
jgi:hypothetical protein